MGLKAKAGITKAVALTVLSRVIQGLGTLGAILFITKFLSGDEQGYYYTFGSIIAIQIFFELGLSSIITQYAAHEFAHLHWNASFELEGEERYQSRLSSLLRFCVRWFAVISCLLLLALLVCGFYFFSTFNTGAVVTWQYPWIILCITTALNLFIDPVLAFFDGIGMVEDMARLRLLQKTLNVFFLFLFFALGFKLYAAPLASLIAISCNYLQVAFSRRFRMFRAVWRVQGEWLIDYVKEVLPFQLRIAVSWISGYFIFQLFNPVLFASDGPVVAGQMGITIAVLSGVSSISMSWITTKVPHMSSLVALQKYEILDHDFRMIFVQSLAMSVLGTIAFIGAMLIARVYYPSFAVRFLEPLPLICMAVANVINSAVFSFATYLRCHKKEPLLVQSIVVAILIASSVLVFSKISGVNGITISYCILCFLAFLWSLSIFFKKRKLWHTLAIPVNH